MCNANAIIENDRRRPGLSNTPLDIEYDNKRNRVLVTASSNLKKDIHVWRLTYTSFKTHSELFVERGNKIPTRDRAAAAYSSAALSLSLCPCPSPLPGPDAVPVPVVPSIFIILFLCPLNHDKWTHRFKGSNTPSDDGTIGIQPFWSLWSLWCSDLSGTDFGPLTGHIAFWTLNISAALRRPSLWARHTARKHLLSSWW